MKIQIDTKEKTLAVEEDVNIDEFMKAIRKLFPNNEWKRYTLKTNVTVNWSHPIYIDRWRPYPWPWYEITYDVTGDYQTNTEAQITNGVYCVDIN